MIVGVSYSGTAASVTGQCEFQGIGSHRATTATSATENYNSFNNQIHQNDGSSWVLGVGMDKTAANCTPAALTSVTSSGTGPAINLADTNGGTLWATGSTCSVTSSVWLTEVMEIQAATCTATAISGTNLTCEQATWNVAANGACGVTTSAITPKISGDTLYVYVDADAAITGVSDQVDGSYTNVFASTNWTGTTSTGIWKIVASNTTARNITTVCSGSTAFELWIVEWNSSVGTVTEDCKSSILQGALTNPAPGCTSTKANEVAFAYIDWANNQPFGGTGMTTINELEENSFQYKKIASAGAFTTPWSFSDTGITGSMALSDGGAAGGVKRMRGAVISR